MRITRVAIRPYEKEGTNKIAYSDVVVDDAIILRDIMLFKYDNKYSIRFPYKMVGEEAKSIYHPVTDDARQTILKGIVAAYEKSAGERTQRGTGSS